MSTSDPAVAQRAGDLFVARTAASEATPSAERLSFGNLYAALTGAGPSLAGGQRRLLLTNRRLRGDFDAICNELTASGRAVRLPNVAAAAISHETSERHFPGGLIRLTPVTARPGQMFLLVSSSDGLSEPSCLILEAADGTFAVVMPIDASTVDGHTQILLDTSIDQHAVIVQLLQDKRSGVSIVWSA